MSETASSERTGSRGIGRTDHGDVPGEVVVVTGGDVPRREVLAHLSSGALVVAADSGWDCAHRLGLSPAIVVGDLDSISADGLAAARRRGVLVEEHPRDKDATDTELALRRAAATGTARVVLVAGGDRIDHLLGALGCLADPTWDTLHVRGFVGAARITRVGPGRGIELAGRPGSLVSLLALGGPAEEVHTDGLRWALAGERLDPWSSRGLSNVATHDNVRVSVGSGTLLAIEPDFLATERDGHAAIGAPR
jgi:thiamine pyrophosphokinase